MNDDFRVAIKRLRDIYNYLIEGEPSPDEEEESQKEMISLLEALIMHIPPENMDENLDLLKTSLDMAKEWDTLEFWFKEKPDLVTNIKLILNRFLIRHAEPEHNEEPETTPPVVPPTEVPDDLSNQLAAALERAMKNLPPDADVTKVIQSVTSQVTDSYLASAQPTQKIGLGGVPITSPEKAEVSETSTKVNEANTHYNMDSMTSTAARVKIRKEDIMKSVLEQVKTKISQATEPQPSNKLSAPKIIIPKVTKPKQKIIPYSEENENIIATEQKQQELQAIPQLHPQDKPSEPPKLKISAFRKDTSKTPNIKTQETSTLQQPVRPKIVVKPKITTKVEELSPKPVEVESSSISSPKEEPTPSPQVSLPKKPKIKLQAKPVSKNKEEEEKKDKLPESAISFNIIKPTEPSVKDTQINLFETFTKQEKKDKKRKSKKKSEEEQKTESIATQPSSVPMNGAIFAEEMIPYEKMDKTQLYQELIALEGKKYAIEKSRKDFKSKHEKGLISDGNYAAQLDRFKFDLQYISKKINEIRQRIQSL